MMKKDYTGREKNAELLPLLRILCNCYSTGYFDELFPHMAEDVVMESMWVLQPNVGRSAVEDYFQGKGETLRKHDCCPDCFIVQLVGSLNSIDADVHLNGGAPQRAQFGLMYPEGKLCMLMRQQSDDEVIEVLVDLTLDEDNNISRIDLCEPTLFNYTQPYEAY